MKFKRGKTNGFRRCKDSDGVLDKDVAQLELLREYLPANYSEIVKKDRDLERIPGKPGRVTLYREWMDEFAINFLAEGHTKASMCSVLGITTDTCWKWENKHETFAEAIKIGVLKAQKWWEDRAYDQFKAGNFIPPTYALIMSNRFGYRNANAKIEHTEEITNINVNHNIDEKRVKIDYEQEPDETFGQVLDILIKSGAIKPGLTEIIDAEDD